MSITKEEVRYIAQLARLQFTAVEEDRLAQEMNTMLAYVDQLNELDTTSVAPMAHVLDLSNVVRKDVRDERISQEDALRNAPDADGVFFRVPKVID